VGRFNEQLNNNKFNPSVVPAVESDGMISSTKLKENAFGHILTYSHDDKIKNYWEYIKTDNYWATFARGK
jgi:hypothetical protein